MPGLNEDTIERQEIHCHACNRYVQFPIDLSLDGRHVLNCPNCGHEHCRVVTKGKITEERWDQRNGNIMPTYVISSFVITQSTTSTTSTYLTWYSTTVGTSTY
jgi:hypothetical protein